MWENGVNAREAAWGLLSTSVRHPGNAMLYSYAGSKVGLDATLSELSLTDPLDAGTTPPVMVPPLPPALRHANKQGAIYFMIVDKKMRRSA